MVSIGWVGIDFEKAFRRPAKVVNDAAMQALRSHKRGKMRSWLPYRKGTYEDYVGVRGLETHGKGKWRRYVAGVVARLTAAPEPDDVVLGEAMSRNGCGVGDNANPFLVGFRLWEKEHKDGSTRRTIRH